MMAGLLPGRAALQRLAARGGGGGGGGRSSAAAAAAALASRGGWAPRPAPQQQQQQPSLPPRRGLSGAVAAAAADGGAAAVDNGAPAEPYQQPQQQQQQQQQSMGGPPVFAAFNVYKTRGALNVKPIKPVWSTTPGGGFKVDREGSIMFELAPAMGAGGSADGGAGSAPPSGPAAPGQRRYDWDAKVALAMSPMEMAKVLAQPEQTHDFYHDTFKGTAREGTVFKRLRWSRAEDGLSYYLNATATDKAQGRTLSAAVSLTEGEFYCLKRLVDASFIYLLGWDAAFTATN